jgi:hypothetical protein
LVATHPVTVPVGGIAVQYDMVRSLVRAGYDAALWLPRRLRAGDWRYEEAPMVYGSTLDLTIDDLLVVSEVGIRPGGDPAPGARKVIYNQNHFNTLGAWAAPGAPYSDWTPAPAIWTVSREAAAVLRSLTDRDDVRLIQPRTDFSLFAPRGKQPGSVALMPRKRPQQAELLTRLLLDRFADSGTELDLRIIDGLSREKVAATLATSVTFIALGQREGLGLPVVEALASGCHVIGYSGGGGRELFDAPSAVLIKDDCMTDLAEAVWKHTTTAADGAPENRDWVVARYGEDALTAALLHAVSDAAAMPSRQVTAQHPVANLQHVDPVFFARIG